MGVLQCSRCKAKTTADSIEQGRKRLDHAVGLHRGKPCGDGVAELFLTGTEKKDTAKKTSKKKTDKKSTLFK